MSKHARKSAQNQERPDEAALRAGVGAVSWDENVSRWRIALLAALLVLATIAAYQQVWHAGYIWDDDQYVTANPLLTAPDGLKRIWFSLDSPSQYFPLVYTTFRWEHALWGLHPAGYHWVNILLHAANALLVWRVLVLLRVPGAWLAAALFALHPVHVESVAWITERKNVLMGLFFLLAVAAWIRFVDSVYEKRWRFYAAALVFYALALFSKTTACTLPAALVLVLWLRRQPIDWRRWVQIAPFVLLGIAMGLVTIWWERHHQGTQGQLFAIGPVERILVASRAIWFYLGKLVWPVDLAFTYPRWPISAADPLGYIWLLGTVAAAAVIYFMRRSAGRGVETAMVFFVATLSPMLGLIMLYTFRYTWVADHYQYLASIGPLALGAAGLAIVARRSAHERILLPALSAVLLLALGVCTWRQGGIYANPETLWRATLAVNPASWMAHNNLAIELMKKGKLDEAVTNFDRALQLDPAFAEAHYNLGNAYARMGRPEAAIASYESALQLVPGYDAAHANLAAVLLRRGQTEEAMEHFEKARAINPRNAATESAFGLALQREGRLAEAATHLQRAVEIDPSDPETLNSLALLLTDSGRSEEAITHLQKALETMPRSAEIHYNLGNALLQSRRRDEAILSYQEAVRLKPDYSSAQNNLANVYLESGRLPEAVAAYEAALAVRPGYAVAHKNLATALKRLGRLDEAVAHLQKAWEIENPRSPSEEPRP